jgi:hypothetical protein
VHKASNFLPGPPPFRAGLSGERWATRAETLALRIFSPVLSLRDTENGSPSSAILSPPPLWGRDRG